MNVTKLTMDELVELINNTQDLELLARLEDEYVNRVVRPDDV